MSTKKVVLDLMNEFLCNIDKKEVWKREDVVEQYYHAMYMVACDYFEKGDSKNV